MLHGMTGYKAHGTDVAGRMGSITSDDEDLGVDKCRIQPIRVGRWWPMWFLPLVLTGKNRLAKTLSGKKWQKVIKTKWPIIKLNIDQHISMHHVKQSEVIWLAVLHVQQ